MRDELQILYEDERLVDPYVLILEIANAGRASIPSALFDRNRGIVFKLPSLILKVLSVEHTPTSAPTPTLVANESTLELRPELLMRGEVIRTSLLIEGPIDNLALCLNPLGDVSVEIRDREAWLRQRTRRRFIATVVTAAMTLAASVVLTALTSVTFSRENSYLSTTEQAARDYACGNLVQNLQIASFGMTLAYADVTVRRDHNGRLSAAVFSKQYRAAVDSASLEVHSMTSAFRLAAQAGGKLGNASNVQSMAQRAIVALRRLPSEGASVRASKDLSMVSTISKRLSGTQAILRQCGSK